MERPMIGPGRRQMVALKREHRVRAILLLVAAVGLASVAAATTVTFVPIAVPHTPTPRAGMALPTLTSGGGIDLKQAFGKDDEDCIYAGPADGAKALICRQ
jgi:hypothetical protein